MKRLPRKVLRKLSAVEVELASGAYNDFVTADIAGKRAAEEAQVSIAFATKLGQDAAERARLAEQGWLRVRALVSGSRDKHVQLDFDKRVAFTEKPAALPKGKRPARRKEAIKKKPAAKKKARK